MTRRMGHGHSTFLFISFIMLVSAYSFQYPRTLKLEKSTLGSAFTAVPDFLVDNDFFPSYPFLAHHIGVKVKNITRSVSFYSIFSFQEFKRFRAGPARAIWLRRLSDIGDIETNMLELIEIPSLNDPKSSLDLSLPQNIGVTGVNHIAIDVTREARKMGGLASYIKHLNQQSEIQFERSIRLILVPYQQMIGNDVYEIGFISDPDGVLIELIAHNGTLTQIIEPDW